MTEAALKARTKSFAERSLDVADALPRTRSGDVIARQFARCGTSVGANYRATCRAKSAADFVAKLAIVEEELDESGLWLDLMIERGMLPAVRLGPLRKEAEELLAITVASIKTPRKRALSPAREQSKIQNPKSKI